MYVVARHVGETLSILDGLITVKVLSITGGIVRLGFDAPPEIAIVRDPPRGLSHESSKQPD